MDPINSSSSDDEDELGGNFLNRRRKVYRSRINFELDDWIARFRLNRGAVERIIQDIGYRLQHDTDKNMALSPMQQLLLAF